jgi:hypothetical protein
MFDFLPFNLKKLKTQTKTKTPQQQLLSYSPAMGNLDLAWLGSLSQAD